MDVTIIGAGLSGLTLALALERAGHEVTVIERDAGPSARAQGHAIGLYTNLGMAALRQVGVEPAVAAVATPVRAFAFRHAAGPNIASFELPDAAPPMFFGVPRAQLRSILLARVGVERVRWGATVQRLEPTGAQVEVGLSNGEVRRTNLVVGCDGVHSGVRRITLSDPWRSLGLVAIGGRIRPEGDDWCGRGFLTVAPGCSLFAQPLDASGAMIWALTCAPTPGLDSADAEALRRHVLDRVGEWHTPIPAWVEATDAATIGLIGLGDRDPIETCSTGRITLIGDAAHPMSPFQGQGGNLALVDAVDLARALEGVGPDRAPAAVRAFEKVMLARSTPAVLRSREATTAFHADDPEAAVRTFLASYR